MKLISVRDLTPYVDLPTCDEVIRGLFPDAQSLMTAYPQCTRSLVGNHEVFSVTSLTGDSRKSITRTYYFRNGLERPPSLSAIVEEELLLEVVEFDSVAPERCCLG